MKNNMKHILKVSSKLLILTLLLYSCNTSVVEWKPKSTQLVISQYVKSDENYSEFYGLLESTGISNLLAVRGPFTLFLPPNSAMQEYYSEKGISSYSQLSADEQWNLAMNHVIDAEISSGDIGLGALLEVNGINDYIVSEFQGADIILNKNSKIIKRDIQAANGVVHLVSKVLEPVTKSVYEVLSSNPSYSIFTKGIEMTGLKDTLETITFPYGNKTARTRFTILAIADTTFQRFGINSVEELIARYTNAPDSITYLKNGFYRYMEYHCLAGTYYLNDYGTAQNYPILSYDNVVSIVADNDYKINLDPKTKIYTHFVIDQCNNPGKNGTVHTIGGLLPVIEPTPQAIRWETTDQFDLKQDDNFGKTYSRYFDGQNTFANIKWEGNYLLYYFKDHNTGYLINHDCLSMSGWWWCQVTTPKIMRGKYKITSNLWSGNIDYLVYVDGVNTAQIKKSDPADSTPWGEFNWTETETHTIKVVATSPGMLFWDYITFTPI